jgi:hypothetical protein
VGAALVHRLMPATAAAVQKLPRRLRTRRDRGAAETGRSSVVVIRGVLIRVS